MNCKYCQTSIPDNSKYCNICGRKQGKQPKRHRRHRAQAQGSIVKLGGKRTNPYWARLPADYSSGAPLRQSLGCFATYTEAAEAISRALYIAEETKEETKNITMQDIYNRFITSNYFEALTKSAQQSHHSAWKHLSQCARTPITEINKDTFQIPINELHQAGLKRETLAKVRNTASLLCREAMGLGLLTVNYGQLVQLPKSDTEPVRPFSSNDIHLLWNEADNGDKDAMTVLLLIYTGMRPSELLSVDIEKHLHISGPYWYIQHGSKTTAGRDRIIPLPKILHPIILSLVANRNSGPLIAAEQGGFYRLDNCVHGVLTRS